MTKLQTLSAVIALTVISVQAQASTSLYTDLATFDSALTTAGLTDTAYGFPNIYNVVGDTTSLTSGPATFTGQNSGYGNGAFVNDGSYGITGNFYLHGLYGQDQVNTLQITFATAMNGFSFYSNVMNPPLGDAINPNNWAVTGNATATLTTSNGDLIAFNSPLFSNYGSDPSIFVPLGFNGIISDTAFTSLTIAIPQGENFQITGFTVSAVPVPGAIWLFGTALAGLIGLNRRKIV